ncbi:MAG: hypothetical protein ACXWRE_05445 [Pseudobdellovibrionaceae bacterium]
MKFLCLVVAAIIYSTQTFANEPTEDLNQKLDSKKVEAADNTNTDQKIKMNLELSLDGKVVSKPQVITLLNTTANISQKLNNSSKELYIEVIPSLEVPQRYDSIMMKFKVGEKENGKVKWLSTPQVTALNDDEAKISVHSNNSKDEYKEISLKVHPVLE